MQYPIETQRIHYLNSIGLLFDSSLLLYKYNYSIITIESIKRVEIHKSSSLIYRFIIVISTIPLFCILFVLYLTYLEKLLVFIYIELLLGLSYFINKQKYKVVIRRMDTFDIEFEVNPYSKEDAKRIVRQINMKIKQL